MLQVCDVVFKPQYPEKDSRKLKSVSGGGVWVVNAFDGRGVLARVLAARIALLSQQQWRLQRQRAPPKAVVMQLGNHHG